MKRTCNFPIHAIYLLKATKARSRLPVLASAKHGPLFMEQFLGPEQAVLPGIRLLDIKLTLLTKEGFCRLKADSEASFSIQRVGSKKGEPRSCCEVAISTAYPLQHFP
ncbi:hypothetical protein [Oligoflexus tunisiensis]|uniref:hypothetical protein n=1 Tax=Oligoflexus tunisiensis TaxID=708132 RepID=UPI001C402CFF|nr:hypothetical protein [Oligoflexus tunisiensis]